MTNWYHPSDASNIKPVPWLADDAVKYLESILALDMHVIEHGSGGSTLWFAERVAHVTACESNIDWYREVKARAGDNVMVVYNAIPDKQCDLLLIDGEPIEDRAQWIRFAPSVVLAGGWIVLDNANRPEYAKEREWLQGEADLMFASALQGKHLITEFYKTHAT